MNYIDLDGKRDFPFTTNVLKFMQDAFTQLEKLTKLGGDSYIVDGCVVDSTNVTSGWVVLGGKLMPFNSGTVPTHGKVKVVETNTEIIVAEGTRNEITYHAEFGEGAEEYDWTDLNSNRFDNLVNISDRLATAESKLGGITWENIDLVVSSPSGATITKDYAKINRFTNIAVLNAKFDFAHSGQLNPVIQLGFVMTGIISDMEFYVTEKITNTRYRAQVVSLTPFQLQIFGDFQNATFIVNESFTV